MGGKENLGFVRIHGGSRTAPTRHWAYSGFQLYGPPEASIALLTTSVMKDRVCLVTGANSGIGRATALGLARMGANVVMVCRSESSGETARAQIVAESGNATVDLMIADLSLQRSIRRLADAFLEEYGHLHVLVNNAGLLLRRRTLTPDGLETTFALNHLSYFLLTNLLLDVLKASAPARIVNVTAGVPLMGTISFDDLQGEKRYGGIRAYSQSKLANVLFTYELARRLRGTGVTVNCLFPGVVRTSLSRDYGRLLGLVLKAGSLLMRSPARGAQTSIYLASSPEVEGVTGRFFANKKEARSSRESYDETAARRLWDVSEELTKPC